MSLTLGKIFDRSYNVRVSINSSEKNIGVFFTRHNSFVLFDIPKDENAEQTGCIIRTFKNLKESMFVSTFLDMHDFTAKNLDIRNQYNNIKQTYKNDIRNSINETVIMSKIKLNNDDIYDSLVLYGFTLSCYSEDFLFLIAERQFIHRRLERKIVTSTGLQIATPSGLEFLDELSKGDL